MEHLEGTANLAAEYASKFNARDFGYLCAMLHDIGKYSEDFQKKLRGYVLKVDHSTAGAIEAIKILGEKKGKLLAYCISGHHSGLLDYGTNTSLEGTLLSRMSEIYKAKLKDYSAYLKEVNLDYYKTLSNLQLPIKPIGENTGFTIAFFIKMIYSCLVDADFIDTETYMLGENLPRGSYKNLYTLNSIFNKFLTEFECDKTKKINIKRNEILERCKKAAETQKGLFTLTVPTGGGKTYSSLAFALNHAVFNGLDRIIYVIPYTSIIEQNAKVFKDVLGENTVLEHHSNYLFEEECFGENTDVAKKLKLAAENWNIPIIVTTNVQFFESLFASRSSKCRKIHNMANSVIIFDEAQMLPVQYLKPSLLGICELVKNYSSSAILCTATQPSIKENYLLPKEIISIEIMENPKQLYEDFRKINIVNIGELDDDNLVNKIKEMDQVLCVLSTRKHAKEIFNKLDDDNKFHLSALMCPVHRRDVLGKIKMHLKDGKNCKVISTPLIEAGVDVDFPYVYRAMAGIDSIIQAAGRCNREGNIVQGTVFVFKPISEYSNLKGDLKRRAEISEIIFRRFKDPLSLEAIDEYFKNLYSFSDKNFSDSKEIINDFEEGKKLLEFNFKTVSGKFKLIEDKSYSIVIPFNDKADKLINEAKFSNYPHSVARKLQQFTVPAYGNEYKNLCENAAIEIINGSFIVLTDLKRNYDKHTGLIIAKEAYGEAIFI